MKENISSKELMLKKIRKALLEKRDHPYPNLEESPTLIPEIKINEENYNNALFEYKYSKTSNAYLIRQEIKILASENN